MAEARGNGGTSSRKGIGGPRTKRGKRRSSLNALKHGLNARQAAPRPEERAVFRAWRARQLKRWAPRSEAERLLARRFIEIQWWLMRCAEEEVRLFDRGREGHEGPSGLGRVFLETESANALEQLIRREATLDREMYRLLSTLRELPRPRLPALSSAAMQNSRTNSGPELAADPLWQRAGGDREAFHSRTRIPAGNGGQHE
jgi:hypothetical protein